MFRWRRFTSLPRIRVARFRCAPTFTETPFRLPAALIIRTSRAKARRIIYVNQVIPFGDSTAQLVDSGAASANAAAQLSSANTKSGGGSPNVYAGNGSVVFDAPTLISGPIGQPPLLAAEGGVEAATSQPGWQLAGIGDYNGDGSADLLSLRSDGLLRIDMLDSAGAALNWYIPGQLTPGWHIVGTG